MKQIFPVQDSVILLNPKLNVDLKKKLSHLILQQNLKNHVWLQSSGTEAKINEYKLIAISEEALISAARGVCEQFTITKKDVYLKALPSFHISGLSIEARAFVSGCKLIRAQDLQWNVDNFYKLVEDNEVSICSLVPTQIFDLINAGKRAPASLRLVLVGGGALKAADFKKAKNLGWPLVLTYGMTETSAMCGFKYRIDEGYQKFSHIDAWKLSDDGLVVFVSPCLFTGYLHILDESAQFVDHKASGCFKSSDRGELKADRLFVLGRDSDFVKIGGESVSIAKLQDKWDEQTSTEAVILPISDSRLGNILVLYSVESISEEKLRKFNEDLLPFERIKRVIQVSSIPRTDLGKILRQKLL